mmetsp:Transcript_21038/g.38940  ORF Transcript_21038/g.38940 Transcript_21038/m.38940 type:complete len:361 (-) Transcript_21038:132-1214(-)
MDTREEIYIDRPSNFDAKKCARYAFYLALGTLTLVGTLKSIISPRDSLLLDEALLQDEALFKTWVQENNKEYSDGEELYKRLQVFRANLATIRHHNSQDRNYILGLNQFADLTDEEFTEMLLGSRGNEEEYYEGEVYESLNTDLPSSVDWRVKGVVNPIKNQGQCGSCWAFGAVAAIESALALKTGKLVRLSEQQLVDCTTSYGNDGCKGGYTANAYKYIIDKGGLETTYDYPYLGVDAECQANKKLVAATISGYKSVKEGEEPIMEALVQQPVAVRMNATTLKLYKSGVYDDEDCSIEPNHAVVIVGYGTTPEGLKYWLVRNSWGIGFGLEGYFMISRVSSKSDAGICGINQYPTIPVV